MILYNPIEIISYEFNYEFNIPLFITSYAVYNPIYLTNQWPQLSFFDPDTSSAKASSRAFRSRARLALPKSSKDWDCLVILCVANGDFM